MQNVYYFNKVIYKGNINKDFYFFCCKKNFKLYLYIFIHLFYSFLGIFLDRFYKNKLVKYHSYLKHVKDKEKCIKEFANLNRKNIDAWYHDLENKKSSIIIAEAFYELVKPFLTDERIISYTLDEHNLLDTKTFHEQIKDIKKCHYIYYRRFIDLKTIPSEFSFVKKFNILFTFKKVLECKKSFKYLKVDWPAFYFYGACFCAFIDFFYIYYCIY